MESLNNNYGDCYAVNAYLRQQKNSHLTESAKIGMRIILDALTGLGAVQHLLCRKNPRAAARMQRRILRKSIRKLIQVSKAKYRQARIDLDMQALRNHVLNPQPSIRISFPKEKK